MATTTITQSDGTWPGAPLRSSHNSLITMKNQFEDGATLSMHDLLAVGVTRGLIIRSPHIEKILSGEKSWEMRSRRTDIRGRIALIKAGSGLIVGTATMYGSMPALTEGRWEATKRWHQVENLELLRKWKYPWQMIGVMALSKPIPYDHPKGAVIWVNLSPANYPEP